MLLRSPWTHSVRREAILSERCKDCGMIFSHHVEYDICDYCGGTGHDDIGNTCIFCNHGERTIEEWCCACDANGADDAP